MTDTIPTSEARSTTATDATRCRSRRAWALVAVGVASIALCSMATPAVADPQPHSSGVSECTSGAVTVGDVSMSARTVTRTPTDSPTSPGDCSEG